MFFSRLYRRSNGNFLVCILHVFRVRGAVHFIYLLAMMAGSLGAALIPGHVVGWGNNLSGQATPPAGLGGDVIAVAAGSAHSLALLSNGTVVGWGDNSEGQASVPAGLNNVMAIAARQHSVALRKDGTVVVWGSSRASVTQVPASATNVIGVAVGGIPGRGQVFTVALRADGTVVAWGEVTAGETNVPSGLNEVIQVSAGAFDALALRRDGSVVNWGEIHSNDIPPPQAGSGLVAVRGGQFVSLGLKTDGTLRAWGTPVGNPAADEIPPGTSGLIDVQMGLTHALGLRPDGTVVAWGVIFDGAVSKVEVPAGLQGVVAIAAGDNHDLAISAAPLITAVSPPSLSIGTNVGANVRFGVEAIGESLSFQWQHRGNDLPGETNMTLTVTNVQPPDGGSYTVQVSNRYGAVRSPSLVLGFPSLSPPTILAQPVSSMRFRGQSVAFRVVATGIEPLSYRWFKDGQALPEAKNATLEFESLVIEDTGSYSVEITDVSDATVKSSPAILTVVNPDATSSIVLTPVSDTSIFSSGVNPQGNTLLVGTRANGIMDRGLIQFDLSSLTRPDLIRSAELQLTPQKFPRQSTAATFSIHRMFTSWSEAATWSSARPGVPWGANGAAPITDFAAEASGSGNATLVGEGILDDLKRWVAAPENNLGWLVKSDGEDLRSTAVHFGSIEKPPAAKLVIQSSLPPIPQIGQVQRVGENIAFTVSGVYQRAFSIETRSQLNSSAWTTLTNAPANLTFDSVPFSFPLSAAGGFYRVVAD